MLQTLSIRDFVIVDQLSLDFGSGFTVLTGETGAGKSILIDALSLVLGARGEGGITRAGCEKAEINAVFEISALAELQAWLDENEIGVDDAQLLLRRVIYADGRSRAFINGSPATIQQLREIGEFLVDIYSQHAHHSLLKSASQRQVLDAYAGLQPLAAQVAAAYQAWQVLYRQRMDAERNAEAYAVELAELRDQVRELAALAPVDEEWEPLQQEHVRLSHGASILAGGEECRELLSEGELAAIRQLNRAQSRLQELAEYDNSLQEALDILNTALIQLDETDRFLNRYLQHADLDPERLQEVENRIHELHAAARKYRTRPEALAVLLEACQARMGELERTHDNHQLQLDEAKARSQYDGLAEQLSLGRQQAAQSLGEKITAEMQRLSLSGGRFAVDLLAQEPAATGTEQVEFLVAGHAGVAPRPLSKVASGGELSRISLAIRVVTARQGDVPTMIFDEVDVGIGGGVAEVVGQLLKTLGNQRQVLVITHLPQVAAQGSQHLRVSKQVLDGQTLSRIDALDQNQRVDEVARMLGGVEITETTRQHATEMLAASH
ncbi:DNA replication and repair protein RecN [Methylobacillus rhizosphaerae]|uniref:DNA repair protein RecN n=1 Tax=Methylobacillus rhizosphaerae TaxID=551994 RepID=A0A239AHU7_9PROT|nr:DNA repair protein RecN [Methylobacillus rhizosphaerae]SNR94951.1 DNA replication and repair protein RecN [Methylobacillus rhizosphaerae]